MNVNSFLVQQGLFISWAISLVATLGSLFFSEVLGYFPCELCWYQRIIMYPLALLLGIAIIRKDYQISVYVLPLAGIGASISFYHYLKQKLSFFSKMPDSCTLIPCNVQYINWLGFITIPFLALVAFSLIAIVHIILWNNLRGDKQ